VFLHAICVTFWVGSLLPLAATLRVSPLDHAPLARFSRIIPFPLALLFVSGTWLAVVQLGRLDALWTTSYGLVLLAKLAAVAVLLVLAAANRYWLVPRFETRGVRAARPLVASIAAETVIAVVILGLVATWRFTPPPRALAAALEPIAFHIHGAPAMANFELTPSRGRGARLDILILDPEIRPLAVKEVTLIISNPMAGIEPMRRDAVFEGDSNWRIDDLRIPFAGRWNVKLDVLINDFEKTAIDDDIELPQTP
jgi:copper transport protein